MGSEGGQNHIIHDKIVNMHQKCLKTHQCPTNIVRSKLDKLSWTWYLSKYLLSGLIVQFLYKMLKIAPERGQNHTILNKIGNMHQTCLNIHQSPTTIVRSKLDKLSCTWYLSKCWLSDLIVQFVYKMVNNWVQEGSKLQIS